MGDVPLPAPSAFQVPVAELLRALEAGQRPAVERAAERICGEVTRQLRAPAVSVKVLAKRPKRADGELHGLYTLDEDGYALVEVWMKTAEHRRVVAFRTFLRTLLHELCHHLDLAHFRLEETFHTEGFFRRESSLFRQIAPNARRPQHAEPQSQRPRRRPVQLTLFSGR